MGAAAERPGRLRREVGTPERLRKAGAPANLFGVKRETQPQRGPRPGRQHLHLAPAGGAEFGCFKAAPGVGGTPHPKRVSPGLELRTLGSPENVPIVVCGYPRNKTLTPPTSLQVHYPAPPHPCPPHHGQRGPHVAPRAASPPSRPWHFRPQGEKGARASTAPEPAWTEFQTVSSAPRLSGERQAVKRSRKPESGQFLVGPEKLVSDAEVAQMEALGSGCPAGWHPRGGSCRCPLAPPRSSPGRRLRALSPSAGF